MTQVTDFVVPPREDGDQFTIRDNPGHTLVIKRVRYEPKVVTDNSPEGKEGVVCHAYNLKTKTLLKNWLVMGVPVDGLKLLRDGAVTIAVTDVGTAKNGGRKYGKLVPPSPEVKAKAVAWLERNGDPFAGIVEDIVPAASAPAAAGDFDDDGPAPDIAPAAAAGNVAPDNDPDAF